MSSIFVRTGVRKMKQRTDRRIQKTRLAFKNAYINLIEKYTDDQITIVMLTRYADVNRATFYDHFSNKSDLLEEILCDVREGLKEEILTPFKEKNTIKIKTLTPTTVRIFEYIEKHKKAFHALYVSYPVFKQQMEELFFEIFSKDIRMDLQSEAGEVNYEMFLHYQTSATLGLIFFWIKNNFHSATYMMEQLTILSNTKVINLVSVERP
jgi:AcrR family transcriptional regulator